MNRARSWTEPVTKTPCSPTAIEEKQKTAFFQSSDTTDFCPYRVGKLVECQALILQNVFLRSRCKKHYNSTNSVTKCGPLGAGLAQSVVSRPWTGWYVGGIPERAIDSSPPNLPNWLRCPPTDIFIGYQGAFPRVHKPRHVAYHSPPSNAKVKNEELYLYSLHA